MTLHVTFIDSSGTARTVEAEPDMSVMQAGVAAGVPEIQTDCGGVGTCAACHVYVDPAWAGSFDPATKNEDALLSLLESRTESSRLSCQLKMNAARDGVVVRTLALEADA